MTPTETYYIYILTDISKKVLYIGITNNLSRRLIEHYVGRGDEKTFTGRHYAHYLLYYETTIYKNNAIAREKQLKAWTREETLSLIKSSNPEMKFLNKDVLEKWPDSFAHPKC